jgi:hypothetical protein
MVKPNEANTCPKKKQSRKDRVKLVIECEDGSVFDATMVDPGNSVSVRVRNSQVENLG